MIKERFRNRTFIELFLSFLLIVLIVEACAFAFSVQKTLRDSEAAAHSENERSIKSIQDYLDTMIIDLTLLTAKLQQMPWVTKLASASRVFDADFDHWRKQEITQDYLFYVAERDAVQARNVYFPHRQIVIGSGNWNSAGYAFSKMGVPRDAVDEVEAAIQSISVMGTVDTTNSWFDGNILIATALHRVAKPRGYLLTSYDPLAIADQIGKLRSKGIVGVAVSDPVTGRDIVSYSGGAEGLQVVESRVALIGYQCVFYIDPTIVTIGNNAILGNLILYYMGLFAIFALLSCLLATFLYRPVEQLLRRLPNKPPGGSAYQAIGSSLDFLTAQYKQSRYIAALHLLLHGSFEPNAVFPPELPIKASTILRVFCCTRLDGKPITSSWIDSIERKLSFLENLSCATVEALNGDIILILCFRSEQQAVDSCNSICDALADENLTVIAGQVSHGFIGVSISYQSTLERRAYLLGFSSPKYYFPLDWENRFISALRMGEIKTTRDILNALREENEHRLAIGSMGHGDFPSLFAQLFSNTRRVIDELRLDKERIIEPYIMHELDTWEHIWDELAALCQRICEQVRRRYQRSASVEQKIVDYITARFRDSTLSIDMLQDVFGLSPNTINKSIRAVEGQTFLSYLMRLRMEEAKRLLAQEKLDIRTIAQQVGYDEVYSFRRAFQRYTGIKVQHYISGGKDHE